MKKQFKNNKGITLIALVITIIVLLILAGVSIAMLTGENGLLSKAQTASDQTKQQGAVEKVQIAVVGSYDEKGNISLSDLTNNLSKVEGIENIFSEVLKESDFPLTVTVDGVEIMISLNGKVSILGQKDIADGSWNGTVNTPKLTSDMTAVYWDNEGNEITGDTGSNWYNYEENKWANAKTVDGSYWVWIPRYEYKILSGEGTSTAGEIDVKFISKDTTTASEGYKIHPAFIDGTANKYANGEWDKELSGIWVMKYEASSSDSLLTDGGGDSTTLKMLSLPGVISWRGITIGNSYTNCLKYDASKESHLMKNSEWGAIAYLTQSKYGRNNNDITINSNTSFYTGGGKGESYKTNTAQSTTGNISGIYDLSGGSWEVLASYITNGDVNLSTYGESFANKIESTKYATVYPYDSSSDKNDMNYREFEKSKDVRYGDAVLETSGAGSGKTGWFEKQSTYPYTSWAFFIRGGYFGSDNVAGTFCFSGSYGYTYSANGFRACLAF